MDEFLILKKNISELTFYFLVDIKRRYAIKSIPQPKVIGLKTTIVSQTYWQKN